MCQDYFIALFWDVQIIILFQSGVDISDHVTWFNQTLQLTGNIHFLSFPYIGRAAFIMPPVDSTFISMIPKFEQTIVGKMNESCVNETVSFINFSLVYWCWSVLQCDCNFVVWFIRAVHFDSVQDS